MKKIIYSIILLSAMVSAPAMAAELTPYDLAFQGYQGRLTSEGIPGYATFLQRVYLGTIDAETLVNGAIAQGKLDPSLSEDESYLRKVKSYLFLLKANGSGR